VVPTPTLSLSPVSYVSLAYGRAIPRGHPRPPAGHPWQQPAGEAGGVVDKVPQPLRRNP
jgi:hypothetical protein